MVEYGTVLFPFQCRYAKERCPSSSAVGHDIAGFPRHSTFFFEKKWEAVGPLTGLKYLDRPTREWPPPSRTARTTLESAGLKNNNVFKYLISRRIVCGVAAKLGYAFQIRPDSSSKKKCIWKKPFHLSTTNPLILPCCLFCTLFNPVLLDFALLIWFGMTFAVLFSLS